MIRLVGELLQHPTHNMVWHERLTIVLADMPIHGEAGFTPKLAIELSRIIIFYDNSAF